MLDAFVIEEIKRRERESSRDDRPAVELPVPPREPAHSDEGKGDGGSTPDHGVIIIDYSA